ncbi:hypothetical protein GGH12_003908 [Coemansia sp. RSA 1822]|nr:hypothetical protein LPJ76_001293 [Coemansia sp. RSA 638]KAJ2120459.1 hypothetical protein IW147_005072 [Coemansia sp. RSA 720]KAJ2542875.1 hypothetical protein GGF49_002508 [Coemansia sp. RSA 1853]KAJ2561533.1 hypothetical protein GGH12_003908 [Coemansia sp. RSA 1822]
MTDFSENNGATGNVFRPYAEPVGRNSGVLADLNPLDSLRRLNTSDGEGMRLPVSLDMRSLSDMDIDLDMDELDTTQAAMELAKFAGFRFLTTLVANPFNVAQTLLQVQHLPLAVREERAASNDGTPDPDDPAYYEYLRARHSGRTSRVVRATTDHSGYVDGRPGYELGALDSGKLSVVRKLVGHPTEGVLSVFKGAFTQWTYDMLHLLLQPTLEGALNEALGVYDGSGDAATGALTLVASMVVVGWALSPLELVRTRLVVQAASPIHRKYRGVVHALRTVAREEGGLRALYFSPFHLVPTLVKHTLDAVFRGLGAPAINLIANVDEFDHPTMFACCGLAWRTLSAVVMLPIDTVRTRLQAQPRYTQVKDDFRTCVPLARPYTGMANCLWRVVAEDGRGVKQMRDRASNVGHYGLRGLYPGLSVQVMANFLVFGLGFIGADDDSAF